MKILIAADTDPLVESGGAERMLMEEAAGLAKRGHAPTVLTRRAGGYLPGRETHSAFTIVRFDTPSGKGPRALVRTLLSARRAAHREIAERRYDLIFVQQPMVGYGALGASAARSLPVAYNHYSPWSDEYLILASSPSSPSTRLQAAIRRYLEGRVVARSGVVRVMSGFMQARCAELHSVPRAKLTLIPGGVDTERFHPPPDRGRVRARLGITPDQTLLLTVRRLVPRMGLHNLIRAMAIVRERVANAVCLIGGKGPLEGELRELASREGLDKTVCFAGFIPDADLAAYYGAADLVVIPTTALEGFGLVTVESLACGTPVVGTPIGGTQEILRGLDPQLMLPGTSPQAIAEGVLANLERLRGDGQVRARCREYAADRYAWPPIIERLEAMLQGIACS